MATGSQVLERVEESSRMNNRLQLLAMAVAHSVAFAGCGNPPGHYPVYGKVLYKGEPASGAVVYFHLEGPSTATRETIPFGIADADGSFHLTCDGVGDGCPPGKYAVLVEWKGAPESPAPEPKPVPVKGKPKAQPKGFTVNRQMARQGVDRLKGHYFDISQPVLHAEVLPQSNSLPPFEVGG
jgi:hypothetical protein